MSRCQSGCWPVKLKTFTQDFQSHMPNLEAEFISLRYRLIVTGNTFELSLTTMPSRNQTNSRETQDGEIDLLISGLSLEVEL